MSASIRERIASARARAGDNPVLLGYDANGIQALITASSRPLAMLGVSTTIAGFDDWARRSVSAVFAGGGRGIELLPHTAATQRAHELTRKFRDDTYGGVLATAFVPLADRNERASLRWLRQRLELAKDQCPPVGEDCDERSFPRSKAEQCDDCGEHRRALLPGHMNHERKAICRRCHAMVLAGRENARDLDEKVQSLLDLVPEGRRVAALSLDGNNLGAVFDRLETLEATAAFSEALGQLFKASAERARDALRDRHRRNQGRYRNNKLVSLATGGDDLRIFLVDTDLVNYVDAFIRALHDGADKLGARGGHFAPFQSFGVGIGAVVADPHLPAKRLMDYAHTLERSAKRVCRSRPEGGHGARSALDFAVLTAGEASIADPLERNAEDGRPIHLDDKWRELCERARRLGRVPSAQLALLRDAQSSDPAEFANLLRYQVARSTAWQQFYGEHEWRDGNKVFEQQPRPVHLDLLHILPDDDQQAV